MFSVKDGRLSYCKSKRKLFIGHREGRIGDVIKEMREDRLIFNYDISITSCGVSHFLFADWLKLGPALFHGGKIARCFQWREKCAIFGKVKLVAGCSPEISGFQAIY